MNKKKQLSDLIPTDTDLMVPENTHAEVSTNGTICLYRRIFESDEVTGRDNIFLDVSIVEWDFGHTIEICQETTLAYENHNNSYHFAVGTKTDALRIACEILNSTIEENE